MSTWAMAHWHNPYPSRLQQNTMAAFTGKSRQQVGTFSPKTVSFRQYVEFEATLW